jgi:hypothetical protein
MALGTWLEQQLARVSAKSSIAEEIRYGVNHWVGLTRFLEDSRIQLDTNIVERGIRPIVLNRKNALFAGHNEGAGNWALIASLIETCMRGWPPAVHSQPVIFCSRGAPCAAPRRWRRGSSFRLGRVRPRDRHLQVPRSSSDGYPQFDPFLSGPPVNAFAPLNVNARRDTTQICRSIRLW